VKAKSHAPYPFAGDPVRPKEGGCQAIICETGSKARQRLRMKAFGMSKASNIEGLLFRIVTALVDSPNDVNITSVTSGRSSARTIGQCRRLGYRYQRSEFL
jgi:hypothetical protein